MVHVQLKNPDEFMGMVLTVKENRSPSPITTLIIRNELPSSEGSPTCFYSLIVGEHAHFKCSLRAPREVLDAFNVALIATGITCLIGEGKILVGE